MEAANLESDIDDKKRVYRKALESIPNSVKLWKESISLENDESAKILLTRAVECVPHSVELWIALARLCNYQEAQQVLNEARRQIPGSAEIWVAACTLQEANNKNSAVINLLRNIDLYNYSAWNK